MEGETLPVCWCGAFRCVLIQGKGGYSSAMILENKLLLPINLGGVLRPFLSYLEFNILQWKKRFTNENHSKQLPLFSEVHIPSKFIPESDCIMLKEPKCFITDSAGLS